MVGFRCRTSRAVAATALAVAFTCGVVLAAGCRKVPDRDALTADRSPPVALVNGVRISRDDVATQMRVRGQTAAAALRELIDFEVLAQEAAAAGIARDADDEQARKSVLVERLIEQEIEPRLRPEAITDAEVRALYERGRKRYVHGRQVELDVLAIFTGARMSADRREKLHQVAMELATEIAARGRPATGGSGAIDFAALAKEPRWAERGVSYSRVSQELDGPFPRVLGQAAQKLHRTGEQTPLVGDETGYYIGRYVSDRPAENVRFEEVADSLRTEMWEPWRRHKFLQLTAALAGGHEIELLGDRVD